MNNEEKKLTPEEEAIPLGGELTEIEAEETEVAIPEKDNENTKLEIKTDNMVLLTSDGDEPTKLSKKKNKKDKSDKKKNTVGRIIVKIIAIILAVILIISALAGVLVYTATRDNIPKSTNENPGKFEFSMDMLEVHIFELAATLSLGEKDLDSILGIFTQSFNAQNSMIKFDDLFTDIVDDNLNVYARVSISKSGINLTLPVHVVLQVEYSDPYVVLYIQSIKCGNLPIFPNLLDLVGKSAALPEYITIRNGNIYYDATTLNGMVDEIIEQNISLGGELVSSIVNPEIDEIVISEEELHIKIGL